MHFAAKGDGFEKALKTFGNRSAEKSILTKFNEENKELAYERRYSTTKA